MVCFVIGYNETRTVSYISHISPRILYFSVYKHMCDTCGVCARTHTTRSVCSIKWDRTSEGVNAVACFHLFSGFVARISEAKRSDAYNVWVYDRAVILRCCCFYFNIFFFIFQRIHWRIEFSIPAYTSTFHKRTNVISVLDICKNRSMYIVQNKRNYWISVTNGCESYIFLSGLDWIGLDCLRCVKQFPSNNHKRVHLKDISHIYLVIWQSNHSKGTSETEINCLIGIQKSSENPHLLV